MANILGNVRQLLRDLPLDRPLIEHTDEEIIALVRKMFRERKRELALEPQHREAEAEAMTGEPKKRSEHEREPDVDGIRALRAA